MIDMFVIAYTDDILVYLDFLEQYIRLMWVCLVKLKNDDVEHFGWRSLSFKNAIEN